MGFSAVMLSSPKNIAAVWKSSVLITLLCSSGVAMVVLGGVPYAHAETLGSWNSTTDYPLSNANAQYDVGPCVASGGYEYCVGGYYAALSSSGVGRWTKTTGYPVSTMIGQACAAYDGYVYCMGGNNEMGAPDSDSVYYALLSSSGIGTWTKTTDYHGTIDSENCQISAGYVYCVGGEASLASIPTDVVYFAQVSASGVGAWSATTDYPVTIENQNCLASGGYLYCLGGFTSDDSDTSAAYFAPISSSGVGTWEKTTSYPTDSQSDTSVLLPSCVAASNGYAYCMGGVTGNGFATDTSGPQPVYYATITSSGLGTWTSTASIPTYQGSCVTLAAYVYCMYGNSTSYYSQISSSATSQLTVSSQNTAGVTITGFRTVLYSSSGSILAEGFTPNSFTVTMGQTYGVRAESYGSCTFTKWSDGVTNDPRTFTATSSAMTFTAIYNCGTTSSVSVDSVNQAGSTITGYRTILYNSAGSVVDEGFTPSTFTTTIGQTYSVRAESYGSCAFVKWSDGVTSDPRSFTATASAATFTTVYNCGPTTSSATIDSVNQNDVSITGFRTVLYSSNGRVLDESFTPNTFTVTVGDTYKVGVENYGTCTFSHWSDGVTTDPRTFTTTSSDLTYTAIYECSS